MDAPARAPDMDTEMEMEMVGEATSTRPTSLLDLARQLISEGKPSQALQAVVMATKSAGGDEAVVQTMSRARELYRNKLQANAAADELASLFAECAITEAQPPNFQSSPFNAAAQPMAMSLPSGAMGQTMATFTDLQESSILAKTGRKQIMLDAFSDGSSFICLQCGGLVSVHRKDEHVAYWCN
ncbi:hypothetical protein Scep_000992 [Stephania cephalantha]|uniref:C2HC zinc finger plants domain-containing protein n=1 Tax=Stephania cephalantha TaxID=152367 RepID=A0AAP0L7C0_9MAGN